MLFSYIILFKNKYFSLYSCMPAWCNILSPILLYWLIVASLLFLAYTITQFTIHRLSLIIKKKLIYINTETPVELVPECIFNVNFLSNCGSSNTLSVSFYNSSGYIDLTPYSSRKLKAISHFRVAFAPSLLYLLRFNLYSK